MKIAHYVGSHRGDRWTARLGWALIRLVQKGPYDRFTHTEAILEELGGGLVRIGSATLRRENGRSGVRTKVTRLNPEHWFIVDVPSFDVERAKAWFQAHEGQRYDLRGALASVLPGRGQAGRWFCTEAVGAAVGFKTPDAFTPCQWAAITLSIGRDVTLEFFKD